MHRYDPFNYLALVEHDRGLGTVSTLCTKPLPVLVTTYHQLPSIFNWHLDNWYALLIIITGMMYAWVSSGSVMDGVPVCIHGIHSDYVCYSWAISLIYIYGPLTCIQKTFLQKHNVCVSLHTDHRPLSCICYISDMVHSCHIQHSQCSS